MDLNIGCFSLHICFNYAKLLANVDVARLASVQSQNTEKNREKSTECNNASFNQAEEGQELQCFP